MATEKDVYDYAKKESFEELVCIVWIINIALFSTAHKMISITIH